MRLKRLLSYTLVVATVALVAGQPASAHPGRTDANGGHYCRTNCAKWGLRDGEYHYHNGGGETPAPTPKPAPKPTPKPKPAPKPTPTPAPATPPPPKVKAAETLSSLTKDVRVKDALLVDLLLENVGRSKTTSEYTKIDSAKEARIRLLNAANASKQVNDQKLYLVSSVTDGDTIKVIIDGNIEKVRLLGIDTPETKDPRKPVQCFGVEASNYAKSILLGQYVRLDTDPSQGDRDKYNRLLRYVYLENGVDVNANLIENGYAVAYVRYPVNKLDSYKELQEKAKANSVGLWSACAN